MTVETSRRTFLKGVAAASASVLIVGLSPRGALASAAVDGGNITPFIKISSDGSITAIDGRFDFTDEDGVSLQHAATQRGCHRTLRGAVGLVCRNRTPTQSNTVIPGNPRVG